MCSYMLLWIDVVGGMIVPVGRSLWRPTSHSFVALFMWPVIMVFPLCEIVTVFLSNDAVQFLSHN